MRGNILKQRFITQIQTCYQRHARFYNILYFLAGIVLTGLYISPPIAGGIFSGERITMSIEFLVLAVLFVYTAFKKPLLPDLLANASVVESLIALILAAVAGTQISLRFFNTFFAEILRGGKSPSLVWTAYNSLPFSPALNASLLYIFSIVTGLLSFLALFVLMVPALNMARISIAYTAKHVDYDAPNQLLSFRKRCMIGAALALISAALSFFTLHYGQEWGADYALYMRYAIQIVQGSAEQMRVPWGFPLMLAPVYAITGFDTSSFSDVIYYKIPGAICLALLTFVLYLYFSKRFSYRWAVVLTACFGLNPVFINYTNEILTNLPYLLFSTLSIVCLRRFFDEEKLSRQIVFAFLSGLCVCAANLIRSDGILLLMALGCLHLVCLISFIFRKNPFLHSLTKYDPVRRIPVHLIPYVTYFAATQLMFVFIQAPVLASNVTSTAMKILTVSFVNGFQYYFPLLESFLQSLLPFGIFPELALWVMIPLVIIGIVRCFRKDMLSVIFFFGTLLFYMLVWLRQGLRYIFPILPMLILFLAAGVQALASALDQRSNHRSIHRPRMIPMIAIICAVGLFSSSMLGAVGNMEKGRQYNRQSFSVEAKATYRYIQEATEENAVIVFFKPEVVRLNTGRASSDEASMISDIDLPTYLLITDDRTSEDQFIPDEYPTAEALERAFDVAVTLIYENELFQLYSIKSSTDFSQFLSTVY